VKSESDRRTGTGVTRRSYLLAGIPVLVVVALTWWGIDFGTHWDEDHNKINAVAYSIENAFTLLPDSYTYPGVNYWLTLGAFSPELIKEFTGPRPDLARFKADLLPLLHSLGFRLRLRRVYAFVTALTGAWIYLTVLAWKRTRWEAMCASLLFAFSWEVIYHGRWIAPDTVLMQFGALTFLLVSVAWKRHSHAALYGAAAAAGFACGSKYPGGLIILPVLAVVWLSGKPWRRALTDSGKLAATMIVSYLITTPGTLIQPVIFAESLRSSIGIYRNGWAGYTVHAGPEHLFGMAFYFATQLFSTFTPISFIFFVLMTVGVWALLDEPWRDIVIFLVFPVAYGLYFSSQSVMIVRNYLIMTPFLFMLSARGLGWLGERLRGPKARSALVMLVGIFIAVNAVDQVRASEGIAHRADKETFLRQFEQYTVKRANRTFAISPRLEQELKKRGFWAKNLVATNAVGLSGAYDEYVSYYSETVTPRESTWPTNRPNSFDAVFGPREVNLNYYTGWRGDDRIIVISAGFVRKMGLIR